MRKKSSIRDGRHGRLTRAVVIFFLLYTGADIALPQYFCREEFGGFAAVSPTTLIKPARDEQLTAFDKSDSIPSDENPSEQLPPEEDCFCCARVLLNADVARIELNELASIQPINGSDSLPSPPVREMFRPPRIA